MTNRQQHFEGPIRTYISADVEKLYERDFLTEQTQTAHPRAQEEARFLKEQWSWFAPKLIRAYGYDPVIVRFYEDIIMDLQRELARYKAMVVELMKSPVHEPDIQYLPGEPVRIPAELAGTLNSRTEPALPMTGYEI